MPALLASLLLLLSASARADTCKAYDVSRGSPMLSSTPCPEDVSRQEPGMPPHPYGTFWRKRPGANEYVSVVYLRSRGPGKPAPMNLAPDQPYPLAVLVSLGGGNGHQINPTPADYYERALTEEALGRKMWARDAALNGLVLAPGDARLKSVADRNPMELPSEAARLKSARETFANGHRLMERGGRPEDAAAWLARSLSVKVTPDAAEFAAKVNMRLGRPRDALAAAEAGLAVTPENMFLREIRDAASRGLDGPPGGPMGGPGPPPGGPRAVVLLREQSTSAPAPAPPAAPPPSGTPVETGSAPALDPRVNSMPPPQDNAPLNLIIVIGALSVVAFGAATLTAVFLKRSAPATAKLATGTYAQLADATTMSGTTPATPATPKPRALERYDLMAQIGQGGMGLVFEGIEKVRGGRRVAIKQMRPEIKDDPESREDFKREAEVLAKLKHPNIVAFHELFEEDGELFLVFDYVDGKTLHQLLYEKGRFSVEETQRVFTAVCSAMSAAHAAHVLHRDLKPSNIMIAADGTVVVMDFGISRAAKDTITRLTNVAASGTPAYMAPEQHLGRGAKASDIYALGVCLYESLTGKRPFPGPDFLAQKERMLYTPPQFIVPSLPKAAELLFQITLAVDPAKRVGDAEELIDSINRLTG